MKPSLKRYDWLLVALAHRRGQPMAPVQIQKTMFLLAMEAGDRVGPSFYEFRADNYGPFCPDIYGDLEHLVREGFVVVQETGRGWPMHAVTVAGFEKASVLRSRADKETVSYLNTAVDWVMSQSFAGLLRAIYAKYPPYAANSIFSG